MAGSNAIKSRIKSTKSIQQITKAMESVSAVKMRRSEGVAISARPYALYALQILKKIEESIGGEIKKSSPFFETRQEKNTCLVVIASDKGLAGSFNSNVFKKSTALLAKIKSPVSIVTIGKKSKDFFQRSGQKIEMSFNGAGDYVALDEVKPISDFISSLFLEKKVDRIDIVYTNFVSALKQEVLVRPLLPLNTEVLQEVVKNIIPETGKYSDIKQADSGQKMEYKFEPTPRQIIKELVPSLVELEIYHSILEANASEHAARMVAMKNASTNAKDMIGKLTIKYNKERQAQITKELIEITSGKEALASQE